MLPWIIPALGALAGGLIDKKKPLRGALLGGGLGYLGGTALPGMVGTQAAAPIVEAGVPSAWGTAAEGLAQQEMGLGALDTLGWKGATTGLGGAMNTLGSKGLLSTAGNAAKTASTVKEMMPEEPSIPPPQVMPPNANPTLANLYNGMQEQWMQEAQMNEMKRQKRKQLIGLMG